MELLHESHSVLGWNDSTGVYFVLGWNDSWGVILSWDRTTPLESFCPLMEGLQGSHSVLGRNDSRGVILSWDGTTPGESFYPETERHQVSHLYWDGTIPRESFCPGVVPSQDRMTPLGSFRPRTEGLLWSRSILGLNDSPGVVLS